MPASRILEGRLREQHPSAHIFLAANYKAATSPIGYQGSFLRSLVDFLRPLGFRFAHRFAPPWAETSVTPLACS